MLLAQMKMTCGMNLILWWPKSKPPKSPWWKFQKVTLKPMLLPQEIASWQGKAICATASEALLAQMRPARVRVNRVKTIRKTTTISSTLRKLAKKTRRNLTEARRSWLRTHRWPNRAKTNAGLKEQEILTVSGSAWVVEAHLLGSQDRNADKNADKNAHRRSWWVEVTSRTSLITITSTTSSSTTPRRRLLCSTWPPKEPLIQCKGLMSHKLPLGQMSFRFGSKWECTSKDPKSKHNNLDPTHWQIRRNLLTSTALFQDLLCQVQLCQVLLFRALSSEII